VLLALCAVAALSLWNWRLQDRLEAVSREQARQIQSAAAQSAQALEASRRAEAELRSALERLAVQEARLADFQGQQAALERLYQQLARGQDDWILAEVEQSLQLAEQQLQLAANVAGAISALQWVEQRLSLSERPQFLMLKRAVAQDLEALKAVPVVDVGSTVLRLDQAISSIDRLPLLADVGVAAQPSAQPDTAASLTPAALAPDASRWQRALHWLRQRSQAVWEAWWRDVRPLLDVRRLDSPEALLLSPEQGLVLRENLKLRLLNARLALLARQSATWQQDLGEILRILDTYFDVGSLGVQKTRALIGSLQSVDLAQRLPSVQNSLRALRVARDVAAPESRR
jgi:uroporphyrin-3 C-methyltransferase/uroporphyrinogen III methyltransferase/synthase